MDTSFLTVIVLALTVILMAIGYVQILNHLIDKEENLKYQVLSKTIVPEKIRKKINTIKLIQKLVIYQCLLFFLAVALSLIWLWRYSIAQQEDKLFNLILGAFTFSQIIHFGAFLLSYKSRLCSK